MTALSIELPAVSLILPTMDRFDSLANTLSNLTVYDLKNMYNQVRGGESRAIAIAHTDSCRCRPKMWCLISARWSPRLGKRLMTNLGKHITTRLNAGRSKLTGQRRGASSTLMQEIAQGLVTYYIILYNEIDILHRTFNL